MAGGLGDSATVDVTSDGIPSEGTALPCGPSIAKTSVCPGYPSGGTSSAASEHTGPGTCSPRSGWYRWGSTGLQGLLPASCRQVDSAGSPGGTLGTDSFGTAAELPVSPPMSPSTSRLVCRSLPVALEMKASEGLRAMVSGAASLLETTPWLLHGKSEPSEGSMRTVLSTLTDAGGTLPPQIPSGRLEEPRTLELPTQKDQRGNSKRQPAIMNVGPTEPLSSLIAEFRFNAKFGDKVRYLQGLGYSGWRRVRGDGNCFYRAVGYGLLEQGALGRGPRCDAWSGTFIEQLLSLSLEDPAEQAAHLELVDLLQGLRSGGVRADGAEQRLFDAFNQDVSVLDLALIRALRLLTAQFLMLHKDDAEIANGLPPDLLCSSLGFGGVEGFCNQVVLPLGVEAQDLAQMALPQVLGIGVRIALLERGGQAEVPFCNYGAAAYKGTEGTEQLCEQPDVHVQLRPGHYDLLYLGGCPATDDQEQRGS